MRRRKVSKQTRDRLVQIYLHMGQEVAAVSCTRIGLSPGYARNQAGELNVKPPRKLRGGGDIAMTVDHDDPRWQWAIERGPIIA